MVVRSSMFLVMASIRFLSTVTSFLSAASSALAAAAPEDFGTDTVAALFAAPAAPVALDVAALCCPLDRLISMRSSGRPR